MTADNTEKKPEGGLTWALIGFVVGALAVGLWTFEKYIPSPGDVKVDPTTKSPAEELLGVANQNAGATVVASFVATPPPGVWVAVHEVANGSFTSVLGAARVRFQSTNVVISLLRATEPGKSYAVVLYRDDGDETFSLSSDSVYVDFDSGMRIEAPFTTNP